MISWIGYWIWWFTWRLAVTFACLFTIHNVIEQEGYRIEWSTLLAAAVCAIVGIRVWMPSYKQPKEIKSGNS